MSRLGGLSDGTAPQRRDHHPVQEHCRLASKERAPRSRDHGGRSDTPAFAGIAGLRKRPASGHLSQTWTGPPPRARPGIRVSRGPRLSISGCRLAIPPRPGSYPRPRHQFGCPRHRSHRAAGQTTSGGRCLLSARQHGARRLWMLAQGRWRTTSLAPASRPSGAVDPRAEDLPAHTAGTARTIATAGRG
jgi:hypothetical protein